MENDSNAEWRMMTKIAPPTQYYDAQRNLIPYKSRRLGIQAEVSLYQKLRKISINNRVFYAEYTALLPKRILNTQLVHVCPRCLELLKNERLLKLHEEECRIKENVGKKVYSDRQKFYIFEICGMEHPHLAYQINMLGSQCIKDKFRECDVALLDFFVLKVMHQGRLEFVGYFSRQKGFSPYILNTIAILPPYRKRGYGRFLVEFSYMLKVLSGKTGTPEKPLSPSAIVLFTSFWKERLAGAVITLAAKSRNNTRIYYNKECFHLRELSQESKIPEHDLRQVIRTVGLRKLPTMNVWKVINLPLIESIYKRGFVKKPRPKLKYLTEIPEIDLVSLIYHEYFCCNS